MKILTQNNAPKDLLMNFSALTEPILKLLEKHWDISVSPKGYDEFMSDYEEWKGMGEDIYDLDDDFQSIGGVFNTSACAPTLPVCLTIPSVAHNANQQSRPPIESLVGALISYGMTISKAQEERFSEGSTKAEYREVNMELLEDKALMRAEIDKLKQEIATLKA